MKTYKVGVWEEQGGFMTVKARSKKEAERKVEAILDGEGIQGDSDTVKVVHRAYNTTGDVEEI